MSNAPFGNYVNTQSNKDIQNNDAVSKINNTYIVNDKPQNNYEPYSNVNNCIGMEVNTKYKLYKDIYYEPKDYYIEKNGLVNNNCIPENTMNSSTYDSNLINHENGHPNNRSSSFCEVMPPGYVYTHTNSETQINENRTNEMNHLVLDKHLRNSVDAQSENSISNLSTDHNKINMGMDLLTPDYGQLDIKHMQKFGAPNKYSSINYNNNQVSQVNQIKQYNNNAIQNKNELTDSKKSLTNNNIQQLYNNTDYLNYRKNLPIDNGYNKKNFNFFDINNNRFFSNDNNMKNKFDTYYNEMYYTENLKDDNINFDNKNNININNISRGNINHSIIDASGTNTMRSSKSLPSNVSTNMDTRHINYMNDIDRTNNIPSNLLKNYYYNMHEEDDTWDLQTGRNTPTTSHQSAINISHHFYSAPNSSSNSSTNNNSYANSHTNSSSINIYSADSSVIGHNSNIENETANIYFPDQNMIYNNPLYLNMNNVMANPHGYRTDMNLEYIYNTPDTHKELNADTPENRRGNLGSSGRRGGRGRRPRGCGRERSGSASVSTTDITNATTSVGRGRGRGRGSTNASKTGRAGRPRMAIRGQRGSGRYSRIERTNPLDEISKDEKSEEITLNNLNDIRRDNNNNNFTNENNNFNMPDADGIVPDLADPNDEDTVILDEYTTIIDLSSSTNFIDLNANSNNINTIDNIMINKCDSYEHLQTKICCNYCSFYNMSYTYAKGNIQWYNFNSSIRKNYIKFKNNYYKKKKSWYKYNGKRVYAYLLKNNKTQNTILHTKNGAYEYNYNTQNKIQFNNENNSININKCNNDMSFCNIQNGGLSLDMDKSNSNELIYSTPRMKNNKLPYKINQLGFYIKDDTTKIYVSEKYHKPNNCNGNKEVNLNFENENKSDDDCVYRQSFKKKSKKKKKKIFNICNEDKHFCKYLSDDDITYENYFNYFYESGHAPTAPTTTAPVTVSTYFLYFKTANKKKLRQKATSMNPKNEFNYDGFLNSLHTKNNTINEETINGCGSKNAIASSFDEDEKEVKDLDSENELNSGEDHISYKDNKLNIFNDVDDSILFDTNHIFVTCCENLLINKKIKTHYLNYFVEYFFNINNNYDDNDGSIYYSIPKIKIDKCNSVTNIKDEHNEENISDSNDINNVTVKSEESSQNKKSGGFFFNTNFFFSKKNETEKKGEKFLSRLFSRKKNDDDCAEKNETQNSTANQNASEIKNIQQSNLEKNEENSIKEKKELNNNENNNLLKSILPNDGTLNYQNMERKYTYEYNNMNGKVEKINDKTLSLTADTNIERTNETANPDQDEMGVYGNNGYDYFVPNKNIHIHNESHIPNYNYNLNNNNNYYNGANTYDHNNYEHDNNNYEHDSQFKRQKKMQIDDEQIKIRKRRRRRGSFNINNPETMKQHEDNEQNKSNNVMYKHLKPPKNSNDISQLHFNEIKNMLKDLTILQSGPNWKTYKMDDLPKELFKNIRPINQRVTGFKTVLLVDDLFEKLWEFPNTDIIKVRTVTRGDQFIGDIRIDFYYKQSERTLCRACGRHILKQKFATEHYQRNIYCWKEVMWRIGIPELYYYNTVRNEPYTPRIEAENNDKQAMLEKTLFMYNQDLIKKATDFVNKELKYYEDNVVSKQKKTAKKNCLELDILILEDNNIILPTMKNEMDEPYFEISGIYPNSGFPDENTSKNFCYIKIAFNKLGGMVLRDLFTLECEFLVDWGDNLLIQAKKYTLHEAFNNPNLYDVNLRNLYDQGFAYLRCNIPQKSNKRINLKVRIPKTVWHYWEAIADNSFKINYEFLDKQNAHKQLLFYLYMDNMNKNGAPTLGPPSPSTMPLENGRHITNPENENNNIEQNKINDNRGENNRMEGKHTEEPNVEESMNNLNKQQHQSVINNHCNIDNIIPSGLLKKDDIMNGSETGTSTSGTSMPLVRNGHLHYIDNNKKNKIFTPANCPTTGIVGNIQIDYMHNKMITYNNFNGSKNPGEFSNLNKRMSYTNNSAKPYTNLDTNMVTNLPYKNF
ncbi:conserved protein, unknown function [Plasmodium chabaudi chabaudi]|uniref:Uncharacterized protein n=1 Tax=Plasmodium chabaudi chabaudi TaxID=31271 RepID=A0A4V0KB23_PLACU|nr:conserved protein, unknown function [Plasmodium chabaudi chabaudi]VTZ70443.1 conserved protein, unknown function [Plasmodium chabaudi chabaudi]|eukprot:XP_742847.2 conserved Plasmodium protein, unknown function [Plasmodium chabaudi chabaudi]